MTPMRTSGLAGRKNVLPKVRNSEELLQSLFDALAQRHETEKNWRRPLRDIELSSPPLISTTLAWPQEN